MRKLLPCVILVSASVFGADATFTLQKGFCEKGDAKACTYVGFDLYKRGQKTEGLLLFRKACFELKPTDPQACNNWAYYKLVPENNFSEALLLLNEACNKNLGQACSNAGWVYEQRNNWNDAEAKYTRACELEYSTGCESLGYIYKKQAKTARATEQFRAACKGHISLSCDELDALENKTGAFEKLISSYSKGCAEGKSYVCSQLAYTKEQKGKIQEARELFERACKLGNAYGCHREKELSLKSNKTPAEVKYEIARLKSGTTTAYLAHPASGKVLVLLRAPVGSYEDRNFAPETAHVTEHLLFRDKGAGVKSYLDNFQENGVQVNGYTYPRGTEYIATGKPDRLGYILETFAQMMHPRVFSEEELKMAKEEVRLESSRMGQFFISLVQYTQNEYQESEFGVSFDGVKPFKWLWPFYRPVHLSDTSTFFEKYYSPASMSIAVVGDFDIEAAKTEVNKSLASLPLRPVAKSIEPTPTRKMSPYEIRSESWIPTITIGTKLYGVKAEQEIVLRAYFKDLRNRLMRHYRTEDAKTYSVIDSVYVDRLGFGSASVFYQSKPEDFYRNLDEIRELINSETTDGELTQQTVEGIRQSYREEISSRGVDVNSLRSAIDYQIFLFNTYGESRTSLQILDGVTDETIRHYLKDTFRPEDKFEILGVPYPFFKGDLFLFILLCGAFGIAFGIHRNRRHFRERQNHHAHWIAKIAAGFVVVFGLCSYLVSMLWWTPIWNLMPAYRTSLSLQYLSSLSIAFLLGLVTSVLSHRALMWGSRTEETKGESAPRPDQELRAG